MSVASDTRGGARVRTAPLRERVRRSPADTSGVRAQERARGQTSRVHLSEQARAAQRGGTHTARVQEWVEFRVAHRGEGARCDGGLKLPRARR